MNDTYKLRVICDRLESITESAILDSRYGILNEGVREVAYKVWDAIVKFAKTVAAFAKKVWLGIVKFFRKSNLKNNIGIITSDINDVGILTLKGPDTKILDKACKNNLDMDWVDDVISELQNPPSSKCKVIKKGTSFDVKPLIDNAKKSSELANRMCSLAEDEKKKYDDIIFNQAKNPKFKLSYEDALKSAKEKRDMYQKAVAYYNNYTKALEVTVNKIQNNIDSIKDGKQFGGSEGAFKEYRRHEMTDAEKAAHENELAKNSAFNTSKKELQKYNAQIESVNLDLLRAQCLIEAAEALDSVVVDNPSEDYKEPDEIHDSVEEEMDEYDPNINGGEGENIDYDEFDDLAGLDGKDADDAVNTMTDDEGSETFSEAISSLLYGLDDGYDW